MHACLSVDEIVRLIASELVAFGGDATAVALACCCKNFEDPVLDALWVTQTLLGPLLEIFPGGIWEEDIPDYVSLSTIPYLPRSTALPGRFSRESRTRRNGPASGYTPEGSGSSK
jgi:hypothetical protein